MASFPRGDAVRLEDDITSGADDTAVTPSTITCSVYDPNGRAAVTAATATLVSTGKYTYIYQSTVTDLPGTWRFTFSATSGANTGIKEGSFDLFVVPQ